MSTDKRSEALKSIDVNQSYFDIFTLLKIRGKSQGQNGVLSQPGLQALHIAKNNVLQNCKHKKSPPHTALTP